MTERSQISECDLSEEEKVLLSAYVADQQRLAGLADATFSYDMLRRIVARRPNESRKKYEDRINRCAYHIKSNSVAQLMSSAVEGHVTANTSPHPRHDVLELLRSEYRRVLRLGDQMRSCHDRLQRIHEDLADANENYDSTVVVEGLGVRRGGRRQNQSFFGTPEEILAQVDGGQDVLRDPSIFQARYGVQGKQLNGLIQRIQNMRNGIIKLGDACMKLQSKCNAQRERLLFKSMAPTRDFPVGKNDALDRRLPGSFETGKRR